MGFRGGNAGFCRGRGFVQAKGRGRVASTGGSAAGAESQTQCAATAPWWRCTRDGEGGPQAKRVLAARCRAHKCAQ
eukprot:633954-Prymnesium_polylepis.1